MAVPHALAADEMPKLGIKPADSDAIFFTEELKPGDNVTAIIKASDVMVGK